MDIKKIKRFLAITIVFSMCFVVNARAFDCLSPRVLLQESASIKQFAETAYLRNAISENLDCVTVGACRTISLCLAVRLFLDGYNPKLVLDDEHVWVETDDYYLDASMDSNYKFIILQRNDPELYKEWKESKGVILKDSELGRKFLKGYEVSFDKKEFLELIQKGMPLYLVNPTHSVTVKINAMAAFAKKQKQEEDAYLSAKKDPAQPLKIPGVHFSTRVPKELEERYYIEIIRQAI